MSTSEDIGKLVLRVTLAVLILLHGISKLQNGIDFISGLVSGAGLPSAFAYLVYIGEVVAPLLVLIGLFTRPAALLIAVNMIVAIVLVHMGELFTFTTAVAGHWNCKACSCLRRLPSACWELDATVLTPRSAGRKAVLFR